MRPGKIKDAEPIDTVVLDAGHGGHESGATSPYGSEKDFTLDVVSRARLLFMQAGFKVVLTRSTDKFVSLDERVRICLLYTSDAADERSSVDLGGRRII